MNERPAAMRSGETYNLFRLREAKTWRGRVMENFDVIQADRAFAFDAVGV